MRREKTKAKKTQQVLEVENNQIREQLLGTELKKQVAEEEMKREKTKALKPELEFYAENNQIREQLLETELKLKEAEAVK